MLKKRNQNKYLKKLQTATFIEPYHFIVNRFNELYLCQNTIKIVRKHALFIRINSSYLYLRINRALDRKFERKKSIDNQVQNHKSHFYRIKSMMMT